MTDGATPKSTDINTPATPSAETNQYGSRRRSSLSKIVDAIKKPFQHDKKKEDPPPRLQEAIDQMEAQKQDTAQKMEPGGADASALTGKRTDVV